MNVVVRKLYVKGGSSSIKLGLDDKFFNGYGPTRRERQKEEDSKE